MQSAVHHISKMERNLKFFNAALPQPSCFFSVWSSVLAYFFIHTLFFVRMRSFFIHLNCRYPFKINLFLEFPEQNIRTLGSETYANTYEYEISEHHPCHPLWFVFTISSLFPLSVFLFSSRRGCRLRSYNRDPYW